MRFVDTSFWVALCFSDDPSHLVARRVWKHYDGPLLSTNHILGEVWTFVRRRRGHADAVWAIEAVSASPKLTVVRVETSTEDEAWEWLRRHDDRTYSFVDATSFALMRRRRIMEALAFDGDYTAAGYIEVRT